MPNQGPPRKMATKMERECALKNYSFWIVLQTKQQNLNNVDIQCVVLHCTAICN